MLYYLFKILSSDIITNNLNYKMNFYISLNAKLLNKEVYKKTETE